MTTKTKHDLSAFKKKPKKNLLNGSPNSQGVERRENKQIPKNKAGRKPLPEAERLTEKVTVNFTAAEIENLKTLSAENFNVPLPQLIRGILKKNETI